MRHTLDSVSFLTLALALLTVTAFAPELDAQRRRGRTAPATGPRWSHDGKLVFDGKVWREPSTWSEAEPTSAPKAAPNARENFTKALTAARGKAPGREILAGSSVRNRTLPRQPQKHPGVEVTDDGKHGTVVIDGQLWVWHEGGQAKRVADGLDGVRRFELAPDGGAVSYVDGFDLKITGTDDGSTIGVTSDGSENLFYGELDWVYQEEVYGRGNFKGTFWAPSGEHLAFLRTDEEGVDTFTVVDHTEKTLDIEQLKYPKSGTINPRATLHVVREKDGKTVAVDLSRYRAEDEILIVRVGWTPESDSVVFMVQDREQTWLDLDFADPDTGEVRTLIHEECEDGWVNRLPMPRWLGDGTFLWESERTGFRHLYRYGRDGELVATISSGEWTMGNVIRLDEEAGWIAFAGTVPGYALGSNAYRATLDGKSCELLTKGRGSHTVRFNHDGSMFLDRFSSMVNPGEQWLRRIDGSDVRRVQKREVPEGVNLPVWEQIEARDGETLDIAYTLPRDFDAAKQYPVWINTYSGPNSPSVRDRYRGNSGGSDWYVSLQINVRSASGRGMKYTKQCYKQFGVQELKDIEDAVDWICRYPWADATRVGITGWSYGGFMTAFALTHSKKFKCGIAGAGVYDWEYYDTIYTERYMATPQNNPDGYAASSVLKAAKNLSGELLIVHGTMDDNVHMQNAISLVDELQKAGKQNFTFMLYPRSRHGVRSGHLAALREKFMRERL